MEVLQKLTTGGWVIFFLMLLTNIRLVFQLLIWLVLVPAKAKIIAAGKPVAHSDKIELITPVFLLVWFLYLIT